MILGVPKGKVILANHDNKWNIEFQRICEFIKTLHGDNILEIQHIGSTAIKDIIAKPLIDIAIIFKIYSEHVLSIMVKNNYKYYGEVANGNFLFVLKDEKENTLQHIHCFDKNNIEIYNEKIKFRDFISSNIEYAKEYELLKNELYAKYSNDREKYTFGKQIFFDKIKRLTEENII